MKKLTFLLVALASALTAHSAVCDKFTANGVEYTITSENPNTVEVAENKVFSGTSVIIPASVTHESESYRVTALGIRAFAFRPSLISIQLPEGLLLIDGHALRDTGLKTLTIPNSVTAISAFALRNCPELTSIEMGNGMTTINMHACRSCPKLSSVKIGTGMQFIKYAVFSDCPALKNVTCLATVPPTTEEEVFGGTTDRSSATLYVPEGNIAAYSSATTWKSFGSIRKYVVTSVSHPAGKGTLLRGVPGGVALALPVQNTVRIFALTGSEVYAGSLPQGAHSIPLSAGIYIVKIGNSVQKIAVSAR